MADLSSYVLAYATGSLPNGRTLAVGTGLDLSIGGPGGDITISPGERLSSLAEMNTAGFISYTPGTKTYYARQFVNGTGISISPVNGSSNITIAQVEGTAVQKVNVADADGIVSTSKTLKFVAGDDMDIAFSTESGGSVSVLTFNTTSGDGTVTSVDVDSSTGLISTGGPITSSGTIEINFPGSGVSSSVEEGDILLANNTGAYEALTIGAPGKILTSDGTTASWEDPATDGTVTSVDVTSTTGLISAGGPITSSGSIAVNLPGTGVSSAVTEGDILLGGGAGAYAGLAIGTSGKVLTSDGTTASWEDPATSGTVTSVGLSSSNGFITVSGSPVTTSGTLAMTINTLGTSNGGTGSSIGTVNTGDILIGSGGVFTNLPIGTVNRVLTSTGTTAAWSTATNGTVTSVGLSSSNSFITVSGSPVTSSGTLAMTIGTLGIDKGGTGSVVSSVLNGDLLVGNGSGVFAKLTRGAAKTALYSSGSSISWTAMPTFASGTRSSVTNSNNVTVSTSSALTTSIILLSLSGSNWSSGNITPGVELVSISNGVSFTFRCFNVGGASMASTVDVKWLIINS